MSYGFTLIIPGSHNVFQKVNITFIKLYTYTYSELFTCDILPMSYIQNLNILGIRPSTIPIRKLFLSRWPSDYWSFYHWWRYCRVIMARLWHGFCSWWCSRTTVLWWYSVISSNIYSLSTDDNFITLWLWLWLTVIIYNHTVLLCCVVLSLLSFWNTCILWVGNAHKR